MSLPPGPAANQHNCDGGRPGWAPSTGFRPTALGPQDGPLPQSGFFGR